MDCSQLGIDIMGNKSSSPPPSLPDNSKSIGKSYSVNVAIYLPFLFTRTKMETLIFLCFLVQNTLKCPVYAYI